MTLQQIRNWHRWIALSLTVFILAHLGNHVAGAFYPDLHIAIQHKLKSIYGIPLLDTFLIVSFTVQVFIGLVLFTKSRKFPQDHWKRAQTISGLVLAFFLTQHILANINMRFFFPELETNYYWAASVVSVSPLNWYFIPYYFAGLSALGIHIAAFVRLKMLRMGAPQLAFRLPIAIIAISVLCSAIVIAGFSGAIFAHNLPVDYLNYISKFFGITVSGLGPSLGK